MDRILTAFVFYSAGGGWGLGEEKFDDGEVVFGDGEVEGSLVGLVVVWEGMGDEGWNEFEIHTWSLKSGRCELSDGKCGARKGNVLLAFTSASFFSNRFTMSSPSLRLTAIMSGVHPDPS